MFVLWQRVVSPTMQYRGGLYFICNLYTRRTVVFGYTKLVQLLLCNMLLYKMDLVFSVCMNSEISAIIIVVDIKYGMRVAVYASELYLHSGCHAHCA